MGRLFILISIALLASLYVFPFQSIDREPPDFSNVGFGANARYAIPITDIQASVKSANTVAGKQNQEGVRLHRIGKRLLLLAIILGAAISIAAGVQRIVKDKKKSDSLLVALIALLGAGSAVTTSLAGHMEKRADASLACSDQIAKVVRTTLEDLQTETHQELARQYLAELDMEVQRCDLS